MPKVIVTGYYTKTVEVEFTEELNVPRAVLDNDGLHEWLDEESNHKKWQSKGEVTDETIELNEAGWEEEE